MELPFAETWKIKMVEPIHKSTRAEREQWLKEAKNNVFMLRSEQVYIDLLTDSGTGAMSDRQWAALMLGDESYSGSTSFFQLKDTITRLTGFNYVIPTHQGRAAENVLFSYLVKPGQIIPGNAHFDTTKGHIEARKAFAIDVTVAEAKDTQLEAPFKGNVDLERLEQLLKDNPGNVPFMVLTVTNNTVGGQPVSMENIRQTCSLCHKYGVPVNMDSARFAENAYFIKTREPGYADKTIQEIAHEMFSYADSMTMSAKKDGIVNMGGFIATNREEWYEGCKQFCIPYEGFITYGGMNGRDMAALAVGLDENTHFDMLETRIHQVQYLASLLDQYGIPYQRPAGGHAIFVDADRILTHVPKEEFPAQTLTCELYLEAGIRACEIGYILADRDPVTHENRFGGLDFVRLCIPRRVYTDNHMQVIAVALKNVYDRRESVTRGLAITKEAPLMRHFTVELERLK
ncbi:MAG: tryptophanase [Paludibacteraceae bacterium]